MGFSRQEYWSGVPLPSPFDEIKKEYHSVRRSGKCTLNGREERTTYCCTTPRHCTQKMPDQSASDASYLQENENTGLLKLSEQKLNFRAGLGGSSCTLTFRRYSGMAVATRTLTGPTDSLQAPQYTPPRHFSSSFNGKDYQKSKALKFDWELGMLRATDSSEMA